MIGNQVYIILPASDPNYKDIQHVFNTIRRQERVWVEVLKDGILLLSAKRSIELQNGVKSINNVLSDTRMATPDRAARCIWLQEPVLESAAIPIRIIAGQRLHLTTAATKKLPDKGCIQMNTERMLDKVRPSFASIETLNGQVALAASFGTILLKGKNFRLQSELVFETLKLAIEHDMITWANDMTPM